MRDLMRSCSSGQKAGRGPADGASRRIRAARWGLLACAAVLIVAGACNGGARAVLVKAVAICTECIGLG